MTIAADANRQQPPPLLSAAADPSSHVSAVAIAAQDPRSGHPVSELWQRASAIGSWRGPTRPVTGAAAALTQEQPRLAYADKRLYISYFSISRRGTIHERLIHSRARRTSFAPEAVPGRCFSANGFIGDYQALAIGGHRGYALWTSDRAGQPEITAARFAVKR